MRKYCVKNKSVDELTLHGPRSLSKMKSDLHYIVATYVPALLD